MSSILPSIRSLFRDGTLPMPSFYGISVLKPAIHGTSLTIDSADFESSNVDSVLKFVESPMNGYQVKVNNAFCRIIFEFNDGTWSIVYKWTNS